MKIKLTVTKGKATRDYVSLRLPAVIGRSKETDLTVVHPMVSRRHCELVEEDGLVMLRDLDSLNGTLLGGDRVKEGPLPPQAQFSVGPLSFSIEYDFSGDFSTLPPIVPAMTGEDDEDSTPMEEPILEIEEEEVEPDSETDGIGATADTEGIDPPDKDGSLIEAEQGEPVSSDDEKSEPAGAIEMPTGDPAEADEEESMFGFLDEAEEEDVAAEEAPVVETADEEDMFGLAEEEPLDMTVDESVDAEKPEASTPEAFTLETPSSDEAPDPEPVVVEEPPATLKDEDEDLFDFLEEDESEATISEPEPQETSEAAAETKAKPKKSTSVDDDDILDFLSDDDAAGNEKKQSPGGDDDALDEFFQSLD